VEIFQSRNLCRGHVQQNRIRALQTHFSRRYQQNSHRGRIRENFRAIEHRVVQRNGEHTETEQPRTLEQLMRRIIDHVLRIIEGVDVEINFDPVPILTLAHTLSLPPNLDLNQEHELGQKLAKLTCQLCGSAASFAHFAR